MAERSSSSNNKHAPTPASDNIPRWRVHDSESGDYYEDYPRDRPQTPDVSRLGYLEDELEQDVDPARKIPKPAAKPAHAATLRKAASLDDEAIMRTAMEWLEQNLLAITARLASVEEKLKKTEGRLLSANALIKSLTMANLNDSATIARLTKRIEALEANFVATATTTMVAASPHIARKPIGLLISTAFGLSTPEEIQLASKHMIKCCVEAILKSATTPLSMSELVKKTEPMKLEDLNEALYILLEERKIVKESVGAEFRWKYI